MLEHTSSTVIGNITRLKQTKTNICVLQWHNNCLCGKVSAVLIAAYIHSA